MKIRIKNVLFTLALLALATLNLQLSTARAQGTAFTYQGRLNSGGSPANGNYDFRFRLDADAVGNTILATAFTNAVPVASGLFNTTLDFGAGWFNGSNYWLEVDVRTNGAGSYTALTPLQPFTPTPYAIYSANAGSAVTALSANTATTATTANSANSVSAANISGALTTAQLPAGVLTNGTSGVNISGTFSGNGGGLTNLNASQLTSIGNNNGGANNFFTGSAGNATTSGSYDTANGYDALANNMSGSDNTAFGSVALANNTSGSDNTGFGYDALIKNRSGSDNTAIGINALENLGEIGGSGPGGTNNIALGYNAGIAFFGNESSNIDIGNTGVAFESDIIRIGSGQSQTFIAGVITGNGGGLTNLNASQLTGTLPAASLPASVVTNTETGVTLSGTFSGNGGGLTSLNASQVTSFGSGNGNFFVGMAGNSTVSGAFNTAIGDEALNQDGGGAYNTATGSGALRDMWSGNNNTANGFKVGLCS